MANLGSVALKKGQICNTKLSCVATTIRYPKYASFEHFHTLVLRASHQNSSRLSSLIASAIESDLAARSCNALPEVPCIQQTLHLLTLHTRLKNMPEKDVDYASFFSMPLRPNCPYQGAIHCPSHCLCKTPLLCSIANVNLKNRQRKVKSSIGHFG